MRVDVIRIGNSQGIRIPKTVLQELGGARSLEMIVENGRIILEPSTHPRKGWEEAFAEMGEDRMLLPDEPTDFDREEWIW